MIAHKPFNLFLYPISSNKASRKVCQRRSFGRVAQAICFTFRIYFRAHFVLMSGISFMVDERGRRTAAVIELRKQRTALGGYLRFPYGWVAHGRATGKFGIGEAAADAKTRAKWLTIQVQKTSIERAARYTLSG
jgi:hypothetical protein